MNKFYIDTMCGLLQAVVIDKGNTSKMQELTQEQLKNPE